MRLRGLRRRPAQRPEACDDGNLIDGDGCSAGCLIEMCGNGRLDAGEDCDDGNVAGGDGCSRACTAEVCGDGVVDIGEACDDGNLDDADGCRPGCTIEVCGDAVLDPQEGCDDGNRAPGDGCGAACRAERCGDGARDVAEACDDGNQVEGDGCDALCRLERCGDGRLSAAEACDDGNLVPADGCSSTCTIEACGDGLREPHEQCDDGNVIAGDGCSDRCALEICGNGVEDVGEGCDDANRAGGDGCAPDCQVEVCGNGRLDPLEDCDDGNGDAADGCSPLCGLEVCGNGVVDAGEGCDDGNVDDADGCDGRCRVEACGNGVLDAGEACDEGDVDAGDGCGPTCQIEICGNGVVDPGEACDDGNLIADDGCDEDCQRSPCGDGALDPDEACDDGNRIAGDGCNAACEIEICGDGVVDAGEDCDDGPGDLLDGCVGCRRRSPGLCAADAACDVDGTQGPARLPLAVSGPKQATGAGVALRDGLAIVYSLDTSSIFRWTGETWARQADIDLGSHFSGRVATDGHRAMTGSVGDDVFVLEERANGQWGAVRLAKPGFNIGWGSSVAISRDTAVVGAHEADFEEVERGAVYVFDRHADGRWLQSGVLGLPEALPDVEFGRTVAVDGDVLAVGAPRVNALGYLSGAVYIFERDAGVWRRTAALTPDGGQGLAQFGYSLALEGDTLIVGAPGSQITSVGQAYAFSRGPDGVWQQDAEFTPPEPTLRFGLTVACADGIALAGTYDDSTYVFEETVDAGWRFVSEIDPPTPSLLPSAVATNGTVALVGQSGSAHFGDLAGAAWFLDLRIAACAGDGECACVEGAAGATCAARPACGDGVLQMAESCDDGNVADGDGCTAACAVEAGWVCAPETGCASVCGDGIVVGAEGCDDANAYLLDECAVCQPLAVSECAQACDSAGTLDDFEPQSIQLAVSGFNSLASVAIFGDRIVYGLSGLNSHGGVGFLRRDALGVWSEDGAMVLGETRSAHFGRAVAMNADTLLVGAPSESNAAPNGQGRLDVYQLDVNGSWRRAQTILGPPGTRAFGSTIALDGDHALVGAPNLNTSLLMALRRDGPGWRITQTIARPAEIASGSVARVVAMSGRRALVSTDYDGVIAFQLDDDDQWVRDATITPADGHLHGDFGRAIALDGDVALISAPERGRGEVFVFERSAQGAWIEQQTLTQFDGGPEGFGTTVALRGGRAVIGELSGHVTALVANDAGRWQSVRRIAVGSLRGALGVALGARGAVASAPGQRRVVVADFAQLTPICGADGACYCLSGADGPGCAGRPMCGDGRVQAAEACDDGNLVAGDGCDATCRAECGNGQIDAGETCDDGNLRVGDGCNLACRVEACGSGVLDAGEECDDGNAEIGDGCDVECRVEVCGNGILNPGEECDDGNLIGGDACSALCSLCGNGALDLDEGCDDGNAAGGDGCTADCQPEICGNAVLDVGRFGARVAINDQTLVVGVSQGTGASVYLRDDDGLWVRHQVLDNAGEGQNPVAVIADRIILGRAALGRVEVFERGEDGIWAHTTDIRSLRIQDDRFGQSLAAFEDALAIGGRGERDGNWRGVMQVMDFRLPTCFADGVCPCLPGAGGDECSERPDCGDGVRQAAEVCDDANAIVDDGCTAGCVVEDGWRCPDLDCAPVCGDGQVVGWEECDDANPDDLDGCRACRTLTAESCEAQCAPGTVTGMRRAIFRPPAQRGCQGRGVAIHGDMVLLAGDPHAGGPSPDVVIGYTLDAAGALVETQRIEGQTSSFGRAMAVDDTHLLIGAAGDDLGSGAVYAYVRQAGRAMRRWQPVGRRRLRRAMQSRMRPAPGLSRQAWVV